MKKISNSIWLETSADEAMRFYVSVFPDSRITNENEFATDAELCGVRFLAINGNQWSKPNASISFMVICESKDEVDTLWKKLGDGGKEYMALNTYPWSEYYGWIGDKYGVTWQLYQGKLSDVNNQKIVPTSMFTQDQNGRCKEALGFYESLFSDFKLEGVMEHQDPEMKGLVMHAQYQALGNTFMAMDGGADHDFTFSEAISFVIPCNGQQEIDYYWSKITADGEEGQCGWCKDQFGVSWQIVPANIEALITKPGAADRLRGMKKIDIAAFEGK